MTRNLEEALASIDGNSELVDKLDELLTDPGDWAYVVCLAEECRNNLRGHCTIHAVKSRKDNPDRDSCPEYAS